MRLGHSVRNFLVGPDHIEPRGMYKSALLRGSMALIALLVGVSYIVIDILNDVLENLNYYVFVIALALFTIWLNRIKKYQLANFTFLFAINLVVLLFASSDIYRSGIYTFFICTSLSAFALFGYRHIKYAFFFSAFSLGLFFLSYSGKIQLMTVFPFTESYMTINFITNFLIALVTNVLIVYFLINTNHHSEEDLRKATEALELSRERNEMVIEATKAGIYEWHPINQTVFVSSAWKKLLGYADDELEGLKVEFYFTVVHPDDLEFVKGKMDLHFQNREPYANEVRLKKKTGEYRWFLDSGHTRFDDSGRPIVTVGSIIDIHERKKSEEKILHQNELLAKTNGELDRFVYSVSHDLRAPLSSILGLTNIYRLSQDDRERDSVVSLIRDRAETLDAFIREILDFSRNARTELKFQWLRVKELVDEVLKGLAYMQGYERIRVIVDIDEEQQVLSDRERIKMVLNNLLTNAVKYSDPGKESFIHIRSKHADGLWTLSVADNGIGIQEEHHARIFDMFYQAHDQGHGSGLGLYIVRETLQRLNGEIDFETEYGKGSTFSMRVPVP